MTMIGMENSMKRKGLGVALLLISQLLGAQACDLSVQAGYSDGVNAVEVHRAGPRHAVLGA